MVAGLALGLALVGCGKGEPAAKLTVGQGVPALAAAGQAGVLEGVVQAPERRTASVERPVPARRAPAPRAVAPRAPEVAFEGVKLALVHTANVVGELEPCG